MSDGLERVVYITIAASCILMGVPVHKYGVDIREIEHTSFGDLLGMYQQVMYENPKLSVWSKR